MTCPSTDHGDQPADATVPGLFVHPFDKTKNTRTVYCARCARLLASVSMFVPDPAGPQAGPSGPGELGQSPA